MNDYVPDFNISVEALLAKKEEQYFDRKSARISVSKLAESMVAFANADGGLIVVGISDGKIEGINYQGNVKINDFIQCKIDHCIPPVKTREKYLEVVSNNGPDRVLLLYIEPSVDRVHKTTSDNVFLRVGDENKKLDFEQRLQIEYDKGERSYEDHSVLDCTAEDLDEEVLQQYKEAVNYSGDDIINLLYARGFARRSESKKPVINVAGVLLFAKNPTVFLPSARIRFFRYEGGKEEVGSEMNIIKSEFIDGPIPIMIERAKKIVQSQLREFTALKTLNGKFVTVSEYPEFAWLEGIINAVTHRAYSLSGDDIKIKMFDDRLEISSPGRLPNIVNIKNIREVRYSRNPRIARALTELGWVRELGEGIKRMYKEMNRFFLDDPVYTESPHSVLLILKNNIVMRKIRREERINGIVNKEWDNLSNEEKIAVEFLYSRDKLTTRVFSELIGRSSNYAKKVLNGLCRKNILQHISTSVSDPHQHYILKSIEI